MSSSLPCQTQVLGPKLDIGSELGEYHSLPHYDDDATVYSTCHQKLSGTHESSKWNQTENFKWKKTKN